MSDPERAPRILVGKVGAAFGTRGWARINSFTRPAANLFNYQSLWLEKAERSAPLVILEWAPHQSSFIARLSGVDCREQASALRNVSILVSRDQFQEPDPGEYYWTDLVGCVVLDDHDSEIGRVVEILETGAHDVMRVVGSHQHLIPFVRGVYVLQVDVIEKRIRVRWEATWGD